MQKTTLFAATLAMAGTIGTAHATEPGAPARFLLGVGLTDGGDTLVTVPFTDGSHDNVKAGGLVYVYGGGEFRIADRVALQATVGYHVSDTRGASNGSVRFDRVPIDLLAVFSVSDQIRLDAGAQFVSDAKLRGTGVASNVSQSYGSTVGGIVEGEYLFTGHMGLKLRYVSEKYTPSGGGPKVDGSHVGIMFGYYF